LNTARVINDVMLRSLLALALVAAPLVASASGTPSPAPSTAATAAAAEKVRDGGVIEGRITGIDFRRSMLNVDSPARGHLEVIIMPSTSIQTKVPGYHGITDLRSGDRVEIFSSLSAGKYVAQIIRIL
jgi:hypothetical protein